MLEWRYPDKPTETGPDVVRGLKEEDWICNAKYDGWRMPTYVYGPDNIQCLTSEGNQMGQKSSHFNTAITTQFQSMDIPPMSVLDAEFIGPRGHLSTAIYVFDALAWDGEWLTQEPYEQRWERCKKLKLPPGGWIHLAETVENGFVSLFERLKAGWDGKSIYLYEGIVIKARRGKMKLSRSKSKKSETMIKWKFRDVRTKLW
jgi:ATP-dependent DNA ligase